MNREKMNKVVMTLAQAYEQNNEKIINAVEAILTPNDQKLPEKLQKVLESWGTTPIEEPVFSELIKTASIEELKLAAVKDLNIDDFDAIEIGTLANRVLKRITDKIDEDGKYKTTTNIDKI